MELILALKKIGFTQQEAVIYIELCHHHEMTGYEAAKQSGISRSNAYAALSSLVDKGYAYVIEGTSAKYTPVPKDDLMANARRDFDGIIETINRELDVTAFNQNPYITIKGEKQIEDKLKNIVAHAELRIYLSCDDQVLSGIKGELEGAVKRGLKVVVLSQEPLVGTGYKHYYRAMNDTIKIIADTKEVLAGTFNQCLYSKNITLVHLIREAFINEITLIENNDGKQ